MMNPPFKFERITNTSSLYEKNNTNEKKKEITQKRDTKTNVPTRFIEWIKVKKLRWSRGDMSKWDYWMICSVGKMKFIFVTNKNGISCLFSFIVPFCCEWVEETMIFGSIDWNKFRLLSLFLCLCYLCIEILLGIEVFERGRKIVLIP